MLTKPRRTKMQEVNSSSMSDIAFLLLVFFLVTTTISLDKGIGLILPDEGNEMEVNKNNIVNVLINDQGKVLFGDKPTAIKDIKRKAADRINANQKIIFSFCS
jgi:biopolymer transport protein ExbD